MREMTAPGVWTDMGPQPAIRHRHRFETLGGTIVVARQPGLSVNIYTAADQARRTARLKPPVERPSCGAPMRNLGVPCARRPGHKDSHRSAETMAADRDMRRTNWRVL